MPELPEVKNTTDFIRREVKDLRIQNFWTDWHKYRKYVTPESPDIIIEDLPIYINLIKDSVIRDIQRVGKNIFFFIEKDGSGFVLHSHMKMTGHFLVIDSSRFSIQKNTICFCKEEEEDKFHPFHDNYNRFIHWYLELSDNKILAFSDLRKFGKFILYQLESSLGFEEKVKWILNKEKIGKDAWDENITAEELEKMLGKTRKPIKQVLLEQNNIAGIGNIYADEILHASGIRPNRPSNEISKEEFQNIKSNMDKILKEAIAAGGTSESDYRLPTGERGKYHNFLKVYRRDGQKCFRHKDQDILRMKIASRYTRYCPKCQK